MNKMIKNLLFYKTFLRKNKKTITVTWNQLVGSIVDVLNVDGINTEWDGEQEVVTNLSRTTNYSAGSSRGAIRDDKNVNVVMDTNAYYFVSCSEVGTMYNGQSEAYVNKGILKFTLPYANFRVTKFYDFTETHPIGDVTRVTCILINLTQMYGAGKEPLTVGEFEADCALNGIDLTNPLPYDAGTQMEWKRSKYSYLTSTNTTRYPEVLNGLKVLTFDGSETWHAFDAGTCYVNDSLINGQTLASIFAYSPDFTFRDSYTIANSFYYFGAGGDGTNGNIRFKHSTSASIDTWTAYLQQHPVKLLTTVNTPDSSVWRSVIRKKDKVTGYLNEATDEFIPVYEGIPYAGDGRKMMMMRSPGGEDDIDELDFEPEYAEEPEELYFENPQNELNEEYSEEVNDDEGTMQTEEGNEPESEHPDEAD